MPEEVRRLAGLLERRYSVSVIWASYEGAARFGEFAQSVGPVPPATLAARLTELEEEGILERVLVESRPPRAEYRLTPRGRQLAKLISALNAL
ncbi:MAG TPA: helix-turn-helix domain-containing protein [Gaiellaceae bacterium]|nr:helix-turn-helix domain-containing protein [Gaiellaceae bacterium]